MIKSGVVDLIKRNINEPKTEIKIINLNLFMCLYFYKSFFEN